MAHTLEAIKGGGGSIRLGTTGTISELMKRELEARVSTPQRPVSSRSGLQTDPVSVPCGATTFKRLTPRKSLDEVSGSRMFGANTSKMLPLRKSFDEGSSSRICKSLPPRKSLDEVRGRGENAIPRGNGVSQKAKSIRPIAHQFPMCSENAILERTSREKSYSRGSQIVDIVDIKCGHSDSSTRIANRLKKLGFSKLSQSTI